MADAVLLQRLQDVDGTVEVSLRFLVALFNLVLGRASRANLLVIAPERHFVGRQPG